MKYQVQVQLESMGHFCLIDFSILRMKGERTMRNQTDHREQCFLHKGFVLRERVLKLDPQRAKCLLETQYKLCCSFAERVGDKIFLHRHFYICPCCGAHIPAYIRYFPEGRRKAPPGLSDDLIHTWIHFPQDDKPVLQLNLPLTGKKILVCPACGLDGVRSDEIQKVQLEGKPGYITASCKLSKQPCVSSPQGDIPELDSAAEKQLILDMKSGKIRLILKQSDRILSDRRLERWESWYKKDLLLSVFFQERFLRKFRRMFRQCYPGSIPFQDSELQLAQILYLTRYVGYSRSFYLTVQTRLQPFSDIAPGEPDLLWAGKGAHCHSELAGFVSGLGVSEFQPISHLLQSRSELLLYPEEIKKLGELFEDENFLYLLLKSPLSAWILSSLCLYGRIWEVLELLKEQHDSEWLCNQLTDLSSLGYMAELSAMKPAVCRQFIHGQCGPWKTSPFPLQYRLPEMSAEQFHAPELVRGFLFAAMVTSWDFSKAERDGIECLRLFENMGYGSTCVGIWKCGVCRAVLEIQDYTVCRLEWSAAFADAYRSGLFAAVQEWCSQMGYDILKD